MNQINPKNFKNDIWNPWTDRSKQIDFESKIKSIGDGEAKLGIEFGVSPLGQNFSYDLNVNGEKWEVKKLDNANSFRLGVEVSSSYTNIISSVIRILEKIEFIYDKLIDSNIKTEIKALKDSMLIPSGNSSTLLLNGLKKNEVSESNLNKANEIIEKLKLFKLNTSSTIKLYNSYTGKIQHYPLKKVFDKLLIEDISNNDISKILGGPDYYNILFLQKEIDLETFTKYTLKEILNATVRRIFSKDVKLVLVHKTKGFKPVTDLSKIYCNRITSGNPRCKVI